MHKIADERLERCPRVRRIELDFDEALTRRIALLPEEDRALLELIRHDASRRRIAGLLRITPGALCRRVQKLAKRLHDPQVAALMDERCALPPEIRQIGVEHLLLGVSIRDLATKHELTTHEVKTRLNFARGWYRGLGHGWKLAKKG